MFKIGDKVRITAKGRYHVPAMSQYVKDGNSYTILGSWPDDAEFFELSGLQHGEGWYFGWDARILELVAKADAAIMPEVKIIKPKRPKQKEPRFAVGDRVKVIKAKVDGVQLGGYIFEMGELVGKTYTVERVEDNGAVVAYLVWDPRCLRRVRKAKPQPVGAIIPEIQPIPLAPAIEAPVALPIAPERPPGVFFVGDEVECIASDYAGRMKRGETYIVERLLMWRAAPVKVQGVDGYFYARRFKLIKADKYEGEAAIGKAAKADAAIMPEPVKAEQMLPNKKAAEKKPDVPPEKAVGKYGKMLAQMTESVEARGNAGTCSYIIQYEDGHIESHVGDVCHARLGGKRYSVDKSYQREMVAINISGHYNTMSDANKPIYKRWVEYHMGQGPRRDCFLFKGWDHAMKNGVLLNPEKPIEELAGACVSLREGSEYSARLNLFGKLLDSGYSGNVAYLLCYAINERMMYCGFDDSHKSLNGNSEAQDFLKFFREGYVLTRNLPAYNKSTGMYNGISKWVSKRLSEKKGSINEFFEKELGVGVDENRWDAPPPKVGEENMLAFADKLELLVNKC